MKTIALLAKTGLILGAVALLQACSPAESQQATDVVSWTLPTQYTNGAVLSPAQISSVTVMWGITPGGPYNAGNQTINGPATDVQLFRPGDGIGTRCYVVFVTATGQAGLVSNEECKTINSPPPIPAAPTDVMAN